MPRPVSRTRFAAPLLAAAVALGWAFALSSDDLAMRLNWDAARYAGSFASGQAGWSREPWSSHFALGPAYWLGHALVAPLGGGWVAALRALGALALAVATGAVVRLVAGAAAGPSIAQGDAPGLAAERAAWFALPWALVYATSWGVGVLALTFEDNLLYLPWCIAALALCVARLGRWRARDGAACGALVALGALLSVQAGLYLAAPLLAALWPGQARSAARRARDLVIVLGAFAATAGAWVLVHAATARGLTAGDLFRTLLSRPEPSFFPESWSDAVALLRAPRRILRHLGTGLMHEAGPLALESRAVRAVLPELGLVALLATGVAWALAVARAWRAHGAGAREPARPAVTAYLLTLLLLLLVVTSCYTDLPSDKHKRYEFVPLFLSVLAAVACAHASGRWGARPAVRRGLRALPLLLALAQGGLVLAHARGYRARLDTLRPPGYHAREDVPWFVYFRRLRARTPDRCLYVFTHDELAHGRYQLEIPVGLWDALPDHRVLAPAPADEAALAEWPVPAKVARPDELRAPPACAWLSDPARAALAGTHAPAADRGEEPGPRGE